MRLLLDNNLSPRLAELLHEAGHECAHVRDHRLQAAPDSVVLEHARGRGQILVSADTDFGTLLARTGADKPSVVLVRRSGTRGSADLAPVLIANLDAVAEELESGAVVVITDTDVRIRTLPIPPGPHIGA